MRNPVVGMGLITLLAVAACNHDGTGSGSRATDAGASADDKIKVPGVSGSAAVSELSSSEWQKVCTAGTDAVRSETKVAEGLCLYHLAVIGASGVPTAAQCDEQLERCRSTPVAAGTSPAGAGPNTLCEGGQPGAACDVTVDELLACYRDVTVGTWAPLADKHCNDVYDFAAMKSKFVPSYAAPDECVSIFLNCRGAADDAADAGG